MTRGRKHSTRHPVRRALDGVYDAAGLLAAACLVGLLVVIVAQMVARWSNLAFPGSTQYAGYLMAAASFLAFAHTLNRGVHIRVSLLLEAVGGRRFWLQLWCLAIASAAACYLAYNAVRFVRVSRMLGDVSSGQDATPLWIPQIPMAAGAILLAVCFVDNLVTLVLTRDDNIGRDSAERAEDD